MSIWFTHLVVWYYGMYLFLQQSINDKQHQDKYD